MKLLAIESSSELATIALAVGERLFERRIEAARGQAEAILPLIDEVLREAGLPLAALDGIAFGRGPGSFTGVRIAAAIAHGFALGAGLPLLPVSSLAALAGGVWRTGVDAPTVLVCVDAHMGDVYWAHYARVDGLPAVVGGEELSRPDAVREPGGRWVGAGDGFAAHRDALAPLAAHAVAVYPEARPEARDLLPLARTDLAAGRVTPPEDALPTYLRGEDAWRKL